MARVLALVPDLLFGSRLQGALGLAGHDVELIADEPTLRMRLADAALPGADVLVVDLTREELDGPAIVRSLADARALAGMRTLGFYAHVDADARERAERAGFDLVVPRSRIAREGPQLVERLAGA
jgi:DNA-binding NarL/FixJ family response regulator